MSVSNNLLRRCGTQAKPHILVVEDEFLIRMMLTEQLRENCYNVTEASNADEALSKMTASSPQLIITDVRMPGSMDGIGLLLAVRENLPVLPIIVVSGHLVSIPKADDCTKFMRKPYSFDAVADTVEKLLDECTR